MNREIAGDGSDWSLEDAVAEMVQWDLGPMRYWLESALCGPDSSLSATEFGILESSSWWNSDPDARAGALALRILGVAQARPEVLPALLLYFRHVGMMAWEESWLVDGILELIADVTTWVTGYCSETQPSQKAEIEACAGLLGFLAQEIRVFATGIAGNLAEWAVAADGAAKTAQGLYDAAPGPGGSVCVRYVTDCARREVAYYTGVRDAANAAACLKAGARVDANVLASALETLARAPAGMDRADTSELRAHAASLRELRAALAREWLVIARGRLTLVFPFGLGGVPDREVVRRARDSAMEWRLADLPVVSVSANLPISDVWNSSDPLGRAYNGVALRMPEIDHRGPDGGLRARMRPSVWLSELGNHLLRLDLTIENAGPVELFDLVRTASPEHSGLLRLGYSIEPISAELGAERWDSLSEFVGRCVLSIRECLQDDQFSPTQHFAPQAFVAMTLIDEASAWTPASGNIRPVSDATEVFSLFGSQILSSTMWGDLASVAQWAQAPLADGTMKVAGMGSVVGTITANSAALVGFGIPSYTLDLLADCYLFAASIDGLFGVWYGDLARLNRQSSERLEQIASRLDSKTNPLTSEEVREVEADLTRAQVQIHDFVLRCRSTMLFIESPTLVQLDTFREVLDELLDAIGFRNRVVAFVESASAMTQGTLDPVLDRLRSRIAEQETQARQQQERRARLAADALMAGVAVAGLSGLASLVQAGYALGPLHTGILAAVVVALSVLIALAVWRANRRVG